MKAIVYSRYGPPDVLRCEEIEKPAPGDDEVLIRVRAASVNPLDWHYVRGTPYLIRMMMGLRRPEFQRLGVDVAGRVEAAGRNVTQLKPGDEVFGTCRGAFAEYVCTSESKVVTRPENITFEQAAAAPLAGVTALQALRDKGRIQTGQKVLINGAAGGVGTFAVQIAKSFGADVIGVCSTRNVEMVRSIGADRTIDYTRENFTAGGQRHDVILDCIGNHSLSALRRALNPGGTCIVVGGPDGRWIGPLGSLAKALVLGRFGSRKLVPFMASVSREDLTLLGDLMEAGTVRAVIDRYYSLSDVPQAIGYLEEGHARGKVVITVDSQP